MNPDRNHILMFARYPVPGQAKTRLIPALGSEGAARLHRRMTEHAASVTRSLREKGNAKVIICFTGARRGDFRAWLGLDFRYEAQPHGNLGERLRWAFARSFDSGAERTMAIGADVPGISLEILNRALDGLLGHDVVLGPAADGGYYLIGTKCFHSELFASIVWGTERVYGQTRAAIARLGLTVAELPTLNDIDRPEDLSALRNDPRFADVFIGRPLISVVIPTLNEAAMLGRTLEHVCRADGIEIIVSDGGSRDATCEIAAKAGAIVLDVSGGRAAQMNAGASAAKGRILLFLHADTLPPAGYADLIRQALDDPSTVAGAFRFQTDGVGAAIRLVEWAAYFRSTIFRWLYGDQGLFMERRVFNEAGGFAPLPIMEDFELVRRLRQRGSVVMLRDAAITSARRWEQLGIIRTTVINQIMIAGFLSGFPVHALNRLYRINGGMKCKGTQTKEESRS